MGSISYRVPCSAPVFLDYIDCILVVGPEIGGASGEAYGAGRCRVVSLPLFQMRSSRDAWKIYEEPGSGTQHKISTADPGNLSDNSFLVDIGKYTSMG